MCVEEMNDGFDLLVWNGHQENINFAYQCLGMLGVCLMRLNDCSKHF